jgi:hypothetical protein
MALVENLPVVHGASGLVKLHNDLELDGVLDNTPEQTKDTQYSVIIKQATVLTWKSLANLIFVMRLHSMMNKIDEQRFIAWPLKINLPGGK